MFANYYRGEIGGGGGAAGSGPHLARPPSTNVRGSPYIDVERWTNKIDAVLKQDFDQMKQEDRHRAVRSPEAPVPASEPDSEYPRFLQHHPSLTTNPSREEGREEERDMVRSVSRVGTPARVRIGVYLVGVATGLAVNWWSLGPHVHSALFARGRT
jgi:hypothetical protein